MAEKLVSGSVLESMIDWVYAQVLQRTKMPGIDESVFEQVDRYLKEAAGPVAMEELADKLIRWHVKRAAAIGLIAKLPGFLSLPFLAAGFTADMVGETYLQIRMTIGMAYLAGYDVRSKDTKAMVIACVFGSRAANYLGKKAGERVISLVPIAGGVAEGAMNGIFTHAIGHAAKTVFITKKMTVDDVTNGRIAAELAKWVKQNTEGIRSKAGKLASGAIHTTQAAAETVKNVVQSVRGKKD